MLVIEIRFTAGRYSATPWGRQVNEGAVEWPPSPWRLLRALYAVWQRTLPEAPRALMASLLDKLRQPPSFILPPAATGHTRQYMPIFEGEKRLVFDSFVTVHRETPLAVCWPEDTLTGAERDLLTDLLAHLPYLGRAESWVEASLVLTASSSGRLRAKPVTEDTQVGNSDELVSLLCVHPQFPASDLLTALDLDIGALRAAGHDPYRPLGSTWVRYRRPVDWLGDQASGQAGRSAAGTVSFARYAIANRVKPPVYETLRVAEQVRRALLSLSGHQPVPAGDGTLPAVSWRFSGKDEHQVPLRGHRHAFFLPVDDDGDGFLDHVHVCLRPNHSLEGGVSSAEAVFEPHERQALQRLTWVNLRGEADPLLLVLEHFGLPGEAARASVSATLCSARIWKSSTPYLLGRHLHAFRPRELSIEERARRALYELLQIVQREVEERLGVVPRIQILDLEQVMIAERYHPLAFQRWREQDETARRRRSQPDTRPYFLQLSFPVSVSGPLAFGGHCHFGLGQFVPVADSAGEEE